MRLAIVIERIGPYHRARLAALGETADLTVLAVEVVRSDRIYAWAPIDDVPNVRRVTLFEREEEMSGVGGLRRAMDAALDDFEPSVVAVPGWGFAASLVALAWCRHRGRGAILMSDSNAHDEPRKPWREAVKRFVVSCADAGFVAGTPQRRYLAALGMPAERIFTGYDVVDNAHFAAGADAARSRPAQLRAGLDLPDVFVLFVGRFVAKKNLQALVHAYARYRRAHPTSPLHLVLVGEGPERGTLARNIRQLGLQGFVQVRPFASYSELPAYYGLARALVLPSTIEQWGLVVNEAMAAGLPVLASDRCGCVEDLVVDEVTGRRFDPTDLDAIADAFRLAADPSWATRAGSLAREMIEQWRPETFANSLRKTVQSSSAYALTPHSRTKSWLLHALTSMLTISRSKELST